MINRKNAPGISFRRTEFTWLAYLMLGFYSALQSGLGPIVPFLRDEFNINYTVAGLHLSAFALAKVFIGFSGERITQIIGRRFAFWSGGAVMSAGVVFLITGTSPHLTILGTFIMGTGGSLLLMMVQETLSDLHGQQRAVALTESNLIASLFTTTVPLLIGLSLMLTGNWRPAFIVLILFWILNFIVQHSIAMPHDRDVSEVGKWQREKLPGQFWLIWVWLFISVGIEWSIVFWTAEFLVGHVGLEANFASTLMSLFFVAMIAARFIASRLTRLYDPGRLLLPAIFILLVGFSLLWQGQAPVLHFIGLFICGAGIANLYPLGLSVAANIGENSINRASARVALAAGLAIMIIPQIMGSIGDTIGLFNTFAVIFILICFLLLMTPVIQHRIKD